MGRTIQQRKSRRLNPYLAGSENDSMDTSNIIKIAPIVEENYESIDAPLNISCTVQTQMATKNQTTMDEFEKLDVSKQNSILLTEIRESRAENAKYYNLMSGLIKTINKHAEIIDNHDAIIKE